MKILKVPVSETISPGRPPRELAFARSPANREKESLMITIGRRSFLAGAVACSSFVVLNQPFAQDAPSGPFKLDPLPYPFNELEPSIDAKTMELHHDKHHAAYVSNLNMALKDYPQLTALPLEQLLAKLGEVPDTVRTVIRNNAGGHANHTMFWRVMVKDGGQPEGELKAAIDRDFGGLDKLKERFNAAGTRVFGSGWVMVTVGKDGGLALTTTPNQDTPLMQQTPVLFGNDVWEHAYYLTYQNRRPDYLKAWWNVVNWKKISERYAAAKTGQLTV
jgi:superoxide dismutase, Fe-Mn family